MSQDQHDFPSGFVRSFGAFAQSTLCLLPLDAFSFLCSRGMFGMWIDAQIFDPSARVEMGGYSITWSRVRLIDTFAQLGVVERATGEPW